MKYDKAKSIGIIIPEIVHYFFSSIVQGIEETASAEGFNVMLFRSEESYEKELKILDVTLPRVDKIPCVRFDEAKELVAGKYKRAITPWKGGELWWEQLKKEINIRNAGLYLQKRSLREN